MAEYIEREKVLKILRGKNAAWDAEAQVQAIPAADVRPVVRGKWSIVYDDFMKSHYDTCSCCGKEYFGANGFNFCPNCGAKMQNSLEKS